MLYISHLTTRWYSTTNFDNFFHVTFFHQSNLHRKYLSIESVADLKGKHNSTLPIYSHPYNELNVYGKFSL